MSKLIEALDQVGIDEAYLVRIPGWTEDRYFREAPESRFAEFEDGEIIMHSPANISHQDIVGFAARLLSLFAEERRLGKVLTGPAVVRLRENLDYEPDVFFVSVDQLENLGPEYFSGAPRLVVEVISPATRSHDLKNKAEDYRKHGVPEYWAIDPGKKAIYLHIAPDESSAPYLVSVYTQGRIASRQIQGFWLEVEWLWQEPLPNTLQCLAAILHQD